METLHDDPSAHNTACVTKALESLRPYLESEDAPTGQTALVDLLTDLRHFALAMGHNFDEALRVSDGHFTVEVADEARSEGGR